MVTQILYSQNAEPSRSKEINSFLIERNECVDLLNIKYTEISIKDSVIKEKNIINDLRSKQLVNCDSIYNLCANDNFKLTSDNDKLNKKVKFRNKIVLIEGIIIIVVLAIVYYIHP